MNAAKKDRLIKGTGWYETGFKKGKKKNLADSGSSTAKTSTTKS